MWDWKAIDNALNKSFQQKEKMGKFNGNGRMRDAVCKGCRLPQSHLNRMRIELDRHLRPIRSTPVEKRSKQGNNFYHTLPCRAAS